MGPFIEEDYGLAEKGDWGEGPKSIVGRIILGGSQEVIYDDIKKGRFQDSMEDRVPNHYGSGWEYLFTYRRKEDHAKGLRTLREADAMDGFDFFQNSRSQYLDRSYRQHNKD